VHVAQARYKFTKFFAAFFKKQSCLPQIAPGTIDGYAWCAIITPAGPSYIKPETKILEVTRGF
jgi:hypothetical protein